jgi:hypothetical protein
MRNARRFLAMAALALGSTLVVSGTATAPASASPDRMSWPHAFCSGASAWSDALRKQFVAIPAKVGTTPEPVETKAALVQFFTKAVRSTERFEARLRRAETLHAPHSAKITRAIGTGLADARAAFAKAKSELARLNAADAAALESGIAAAQRTLQSELSNVGITVNHVTRRYGSDALGKALRAEASCQVFLPPVS